VKDGDLMAAAERHARADLSQPRVIEAGEVRVDDLIYSSAHGGRAGRWIRVVKVHTSRVDSRYVVIETTDWETYKHKREGIAVKRSAWS
jgi:hypothetical protein